MVDSPQEPGLYPDIHADIYRAWPFAAQSILKVLRDKSPAHAKQQLDNPPESTPALRLGAAVHTAVLQPELFHQEYIRAPEGDRRTKEVKEVWQSLKESHPNATILSGYEWEQCMAIRNAVASHPTARRLLDGQSELSAVWKDPDTGVMCKGRFDMVSQIGVITDLKTTVDASPSSFTRSVYNYGYYIQAAHYLSGAQELGIDAKFFTIIAVEKTPPYCVAVYHIRSDAIAAGEDELRPLLELYARCQETGVWPGYPNEAVEIDLPPYAYYQIEERVS